MSDEHRTEMGLRERVLKWLAVNGNMVSKERVKITVLFYVPCLDEHNEAFGIRGRYRKITGICWNVDEIYGSILVDKTRISFDDILRIGNADGVFQKDWSTEYPVD